MKRVLAVVFFALLSIGGIGIGVAHADPSATLCHNVHVVVNGSDVVNDASCNTAP